MAPSHRPGLSALARRLTDRAAAFEASARMGTPALSYRSAWAVLSAAAIYGAYDAVVASARVASADGSVVGPEMEAAALSEDPAPQRIGRETIARMLEECKAMDVAMAGRERMI